MDASCLKEARKFARRRGAGWIGHVVEIINMHNRQVKDGRFCLSCAGSNPLVWDTGSRDRYEVLEAKSK